jgi:hypothetical protein
MFQQKVGPKCLRMDNAGENKELAERLTHKDWKLPIIVEWTARDTPQQNSPAEVEFSTLAGRARAMLEDAHVPNTLRKLLMPEAVKTATHLDGLIPIVLDGVSKTKYEHQFGKNPRFANSLRAFGEAGTVTIKSRTFQPKDKGRGVTCMMVGYSQQHPSGTYRMFDRLTKGIHITRDVTWLRRTFFHPTSVLEVGEGIQAPTSSVTIEPLDDDAEANTETADADDDANVEAADDDDDEVEPTDNVTTTRSGRTINLPSYLRENYEVGNAAQDYKIELTAAEERYYEAMEFGFSCLEHNGVEEAMVGAGIGGGLPIPMNLTN